MQVSNPRAYPEWLTYETHVDQLDPNHESMTLDFPPAYVTIRRAGDLALAVLHNEDKRDKAALWSVSRRECLWEVDLPPLCVKEGLCSHDECLSETGLVVVPFRSMDWSRRSMVTIKDGLVSAPIALHPTSLIEVIGDRVLGTWTDNTAHWAEYALDGSIVAQHPLDYTWDRRVSVSTGNPHTWVRLSGSRSPQLPSILEIVDLQSGALETVQLPLSEESEEFVSPCLVDDLLIFGRHHVSSATWTGMETGTAIIAYDLARRTLVGEIWVGEKGPIHSLTFDGHTVAWVNLGLSDPDHGEDKVMVLDLATREARCLSDLDALRLLSVGPLRAKIQYELDLFEDKVWLCAAREGNWGDCRFRVIDLITEETVHDATICGSSSVISCTKGVLHVGRGWHWYVEKFSDAPMIKSAVGD